MTIRYQFGEAACWQPNNRPSFAMCGGCGLLGQGANGPTPASK